MAKILLSTMIITILFLTLACEGEKAPPTPTPIPPTPIAVSASEFYASYQRNEVGAEAKYNDRLVAVSGKVGQIDDYDVKLIGGAMGVSGIAIGMLTEAIVCKVDKEDVDSIVDLKVGSSVTVVGTSKGLGFTDIELKDCTIR